VVQRAAQCQAGRDRVVNTETLGPAMQILSQRERRFVRAVIAEPPGRALHARAAKIAGFGNTAKSTAVMGSKLAHRPTIIAAIAEEREKVSLADIT
jgi:hypothetical protein